MCRRCSSNGMKRADDCANEANITAWRDALPPIAQGVIDARLHVVDLRGSFSRTRRRVSNLFARTMLITRRRGRRGEDDALRAGIPSLGARSRSPRAPARGSGLLCFARNYFQKSAFALTTRSQLCHFTVKPGGGSAAALCPVVDTLKNIQEGP